MKLIDGGAPQRLTSDPAPELGPAWSPDGKRIAFLRRTDIGGSIVILVPAFGGAERRLEQTKTATENGPAWANGVSWTPDGRSVLFVGRASSSMSDGIFLCSIDTGERRQVTWPTRDFSDAFPRISPDGRYLAFVRRTAGALDGYVFVQQLEALQPLAEPRRVTDDRRTTVGFDWTSDSGSIVYDVGDGLWRVRMAGGGAQPVLTNVSRSISIEGLSC